MAQESNETYAADLNEMKEDENEESEKFMEEDEEDSSSSTGDSGDESDAIDDEDDNEAANDALEAEKEKLNEEVYKSKLYELEQSISANSFHYQAYVDLIVLAKANSDLTTLRIYRQKMSEIFPLSENLWLDWLKDEQKLVDNEEDRQRVDELFKRAIDDYLSVHIWLEYIQFSIGGTNGVENVRSICERAVSFAGLHVTKGYLLWDVYIEFESAVLFGYQQTSAGAVQTPQQVLQVNEQLERICQIFRNKLSTCLENVEGTLAELSEFDASKVTDEIKLLYKKSLDKFKKIEPFETALTNAGDDAAKKLTEYKRYLDFEVSAARTLEKQLTNVSKAGAKSAAASARGEQASVAAAVSLALELTNQLKRIRCLFERAIADGSNCLDESLWLKYVYFVSNDFEEAQECGDESFHVNLLKRSIRNCTWSSKLWIAYALSLEKSLASAEQIKGVYNKAMNSGLQTSADYLQMWHAYLDYLRRIIFAATPSDTAASDKRDEQIEDLRECFQKAINQLFDFFKHNGDPTFSLEKYWALVEAKHLKNMEKTRKIYNEMILNKGDIGKYAAVWIELYDLEKQYGDAKHQRKLLHRALNEVSGGIEKEIIHELVYQFEKLNGNAHQARAAFLKYEQFKLERQQQLAEKRAERNAASGRSDGATAPINGAKSRGDSFAKKEFANARPTGGKEQQSSKKVVEPKASKNEASAESNLKRKKSDISNSVTESVAGGARKSPDCAKDTDGFSIPSVPVQSGAAAKEFQQPAAKKSKSDEKAVPSKSPTETVHSSTMNSNLTVFISNLNYEIDENKIRDVFDKQPGFKNIRLIKHWSGKNKGYGYVDFETPDQATNALKLDRTPIDGRPLFVSKNEDKSLDFGQSKFKFGTHLEKNKLFIASLPFSTDKKALEDIFSKFGKLKEVRIVTYKNGKSKGLAYVDFEDEQSASKALLQTDGMLIGEHQISVAISNPPKRKQPDDTDGGGNEKMHQQLSSSLGSGSFNMSNVAPASSSSSSNGGSSNNKTSSVASFLPRSQVINTNRKKKLNLI